MKKIGLYYLAIAAAMFVAGCGSNSPQEAPDWTETAEDTTAEGVKLLESICDKKGEVIMQFEYDEQNRLVSIIHAEGYGETKISYTDKRITVENKADQQQFRYYNIKDNKVTFKLDLGSGERLETYKIDKQGYLLSYKSGLRTGCGDYDEEADAFKEAPYLVEYQYEKGNLITVSDNAGDCEYYAGGSGGYKYDDKLSPFTNCKSPKWLLQILIDDFYASKNNITEHSEGHDNFILLLYKYVYDKDGFPVRKTTKLSKESVDAGDYMMFDGDVVQFVYVKK